jgi:hypothetical protein
MSETSSNQLLVKQQWNKMALSFAIGFVTNACVGWLAIAATGAGHGPSTLFNLTVGPGYVTFILLPFAYAGIASRRPAAMCLALIFEVLHHLWSFVTEDGIAKLGEAERRLGLEDFCQWLVIYLLAHGYIWFGFLRPWHGAQDRKSSP